MSAKITTILLGLCSIAVCDVFIQNALVVIVGVGKYDNDLQLEDISVPVGQDLELMHNLWSDYGHTVIDTTRYYSSSLFLRRDDFMEFMNVTIKQLLTQNSTKYDAFIFFSSSHGRHHSIIFSDQHTPSPYPFIKWFNDKKVDAFDIERFMYQYFANKELFRYAAIPKLFFINKCRHFPSNQYTFGDRMDHDQQQQQVMHGDNFRWFFPSSPGSKALGNEYGSYLFQTVHGVMEKQYKLLLNDGEQKSESLTKIQEKMYESLKKYKQILNDQGSLLMNNVFFRLNLEKFANSILFFISHCIKHIKIPPLEDIKVSIFSTIKNAKTIYSFYRFKKMLKSE
eukprot:390848_1